MRADKKGVKVKGCRMNCLVAGIDLGGCAPAYPHTQNDGRIFPQT
jgi:hypothetical protein